MKKNFLKKAVPVVLAMSMAIPVAVFAESSADVDAVTHETEKNIMETVAAGNTEETTPGVDVEETTTAGTDDTEETTTVTEAGTDDVTDNKTDSSTDKTEETSKETETTAKEEETTVDKKETATIHIEYVDEEGIVIPVYLGELSDDYGYEKEVDVLVNAHESYDLSKYAISQSRYELITSPDVLKGDNLQAGSTKTIRIVYKRKMCTLKIQFATKDGELLKKTTSVTIPRDFNYLYVTDKNVAKTWDDMIKNAPYERDSSYFHQNADFMSGNVQFELFGIEKQDSLSAFIAGGLETWDETIPITLIGYLPESTSSDTATKPEKNTTTNEDSIPQKETVTKKTVKSANDKTAVTTASTETATANQTAGTNNNPKTGVPFPVYPVAGGLLAGVAAFFARKKK